MPLARARFSISRRRKREKAERRKRAIDEICMFAFVTCALTRLAADLAILNIAYYLIAGSRICTNFHSLRPFHADRHTHTHTLSLSLSVPLGARDRDIVSLSLSLFTEPCDRSERERERGGGRGAWDRSGECMEMNVIKLFYRNAESTRRHKLTPTTSN